MRVFEPLVGGLEVRMFDLVSDETMEHDCLEGGFSFAARELGSREEEPSFMELSRLAKDLFAEPVVLIQRLIYRHA